MKSPTNQSDLARLLQGFFCHYLIQQRQVSPQTVRGYRDTFRLLLHFSEDYRGQSISEIALRDLDAPLILAFLEALDNQTWSGQRDRALLMTLYNTGARVSEIIAVRRIDLETEQNQALHLHGKGRKERVIPLWKCTTRLLKAWSPRIGPEPQQSLFPNRFGQTLTRSGVTARLKLAVNFKPSNTLLAFLDSL